MPGHEIVTRPYSMASFNGKEVGIIPSRVMIVSDLGKFDIGLSETKSVLAKKIIDLYGKRVSIFESEVPDMFLYLKQVLNSERLAPKVQIYNTDVMLENLKNGFLRSIIVGNEGVNYRRLKKDMYEVTRLSQSGVLEVGNLYLGYRINL